jgi:hypothetical protein
MKAQLQQLVGEGKRQRVFVCIKESVIGDRKRKEWRGRRFNGNATETAPDQRDGAATGGQYSDNRLP